MLFVLVIAGCSGTVDDDRLRGIYFDSVTKACIFVYENECGVYFPSRRNGQNSRLNGTCKGSWMLKSIYMTVPTSPAFDHPEFRTGSVTLKYNKETDSLTTENGKRVFVKLGSDDGFCR